MGRFVVAAAAAAVVVAVLVVVVDFALIAPAATASAFASNGTAVVLGAVRLNRLKALSNIIVDE